MSTNDEQIKELRDKIATARDELGARPKLAYETNAVLFINNEMINFNVLTAVDQCVCLAASIMVEEASFDRANQFLGTDVKPHMGDFTTEQWLADVKLRCEYIQWQDKKKHLDSMDAKLAELMSADAKTASAIDDIAGQLGL